MNNDHSIYTKQKKDFSSGFTSKELTAILNHVLSTGDLKELVDVPIATPKGVKTYTVKYVEVGDAHIQLTHHQYRYYCVTSCRKFTEFSLLRSELELRLNVPRGDILLVDKADFSNSILLRSVCNAFHAAYGSIFDSYLESGKLAADTAAQEIKRSKAKDASLRQRCKTFSYREQQNIGRTLMKLVLNYQMSRSPRVIDDESFIFTYSYKLGSTEAPSYLASLTLGSYTPADFDKSGKRLLESIESIRIDRSYLMDKLFQSKLASCRRFATLFGDNKFINAALLDTEPSVRLLASLRRKTTSWK